jgi:hypothetical protein
MAKFTITKDYTNAKAKTEIKAEAMQIIMDALIAAYGEENVSWVRTGNGDSKSNEIAAIAGMVEVDGQEVPACFTVNASAKDFVDRKTTKKTFEAFDFYKAKADYESYVAEKAEKDADRAAKKAEKIANDKKKREETSEF